MDFLDTRLDLIAHQEFFHTAVWLYANPQAPDALHVAPSE
jgi:hypothetical protein